jgi:enoyl-CoA hydratase
MHKDTNETVQHQVRYELPAEGVARITLARPEARNAQGMQMTYELNSAFDRAAHDDSVSVIILAADGPHFSAGHDLGGDKGKTWRDFHTVSTWGDFEAGGAAGRYYREKEIYLGMAERWRGIPKPTIAAVQGKCMTGGLLLAWVCDLIVASEDAQFADTTGELGVCGVEFFMHPYELGTRKAKEWLFTGDWLSAGEAASRGMVNRVVPGEKLEIEVLELARTIAGRPSFALRTIKEACNQAQDLMGRTQTVQNAFALHQLGHAHNQMAFGIPIDPSSLPPAMREKYEGHKRGGSDTSDDSAS